MKRGFNRTYGYKYCFAVKTFKITKRGRKYFDCEISGHKAKLVINTHSENLSDGDVVVIHVSDLCEKNKYGTKLLFEPLRIFDAGVDEETAKKILADYAEAKKWLEYAEVDAGNGYFYSNAISKALSLCPSQNGFTVRLAKLKDSIEKNRSDYRNSKIKKSSPCDDGEWADLIF